MPSTIGDFGAPNAPTRCLAHNRDGQQCKGPAVVGSRVCRMHGGASLKGTAAPSFKHGRYSKYLPSQLDALYQDAISNPDLLEMADHIGLLEARIQEILEAAKGGDPVPTWSEVKEAFSEVETSILAGDSDLYIGALERMHRALDAGQKWDTTWAQILGTMEQLRRMTDTEVKRKKELHQMIPVERVIILMAAVGQAVKRNVTNPAEIQAVYRELAILHGSDNTHTGKKAGPEFIDVAPETRGVSGGGSHMAVKRRRRRERKMEAMKALNPPSTPTGTESGEGNA